jgi:hypothetical protein
MPGTHVDGIDALCADTYPCSVLARDGGRVSLTDWCPRQNFYRLENEHLANVENQRYVRMRGATNNNADEHALVNVTLLFHDRRA